MKQTHTTRSDNAAWSRRDWLRAGVLGPLGLSLGDWFRLRAQASSTQAGNFASPAQACILIWLSGGPSHIDTFDPKPSAPSDVRGTFEPINTALPGVHFSELLPELARVLDRASLIRSLTSPESDHDRAAHHKLTGYRPSPAIVYPSLGSVVAKAREDLPGGTLPPHVALPSAPPFASSGYLTPAYDPFASEADPNSPGFRVRNLTPPDRLTLSRLQRRRGMVSTLDQFTRDTPETTLTRSRDRFAARAFELLTSPAAQTAFDLANEPDAVRERYGRTQIGQSCLLARRLVERGVAFVTINDLGNGQLGWDTHVQNFPTLKDRLAPPLDRGVASLIADLNERGMLESTLLVMMGEFGRTPKINENAGRDHHGRACSVLLAGGGLKPGVVLGTTDPKGDAPIERPVTPAELAATIFTRLGIDPSTRFLTSDNQPIRLVDTGEPIAELL